MHTLNRHTVYNITKVTHVPDASLFLSLQKKEFTINPHPPPNTITNSHHKHS